MKKRGFLIAILAAALCLLVLASTAAAEGQLTIYEGPRTMESSRTASVRVNGYDLFVYDVMVNHEHIWNANTIPSFTPMTYFDFRGQVRIEVKIPGLEHPVESAVVLPTAAGIVPKVENGLVRFELTEPGQYTVVFNSNVNKALHIFANPPEEKVPDPEDPNGAYAGALEAKERGWIRHIGVTSHRVDVAEQCIASGWFETLQFPFSYISSERDLALAAKCKDADMGYIAMKGLAGGMLTNTRACHAFMNCYDNVVPIWGIQKMEELEQWLAVAEEDPQMDEELDAFIRRERQELSGSFCRSCGYCMPCPMGIEIRNCARMNMLLRRSPWQQYMTPAWQLKMNKIEDCIECHRCSSRCPYQLDTPNLLKYMLKDYREFYESHKDLL